MDTKTDISIKEICKALDIKQETALKWLKNDEFFNELMDNFNKINRYFIIDILKKLNSMAKDGDIKAIKLLMEFQSKLLVNGNDFSKVVIIDDIQHST